MILDLLAVALLSFGAVHNASSKTLDHSDYTVTKRNASLNYSLYSGYCISHYDDNEPFFTEDNIYENDVDFQIQIDDNGYIPVYATYHNENSYYNNNLIRLDSFGITYSASDDYISIGGTYDSEHFDNERFYILFEINDTFNDVLADSPFLADFGLYFVDIVGVSTPVVNIVNRVLTHNVSDNFVTYTGWYHMHSGYYPNNTIYSLVPSMNIIFDNSIYNEFFHGYAYYPGSTNYALFKLTDYSADLPPRTFESTTTPFTFNVYFSSIMVHRDIYDNLLLFGDFDFVDESPDYGLDDLFYNIADTPVIFITHLFDFELFGTPFYVAFLGVVSVVVLVFILKKVL